MIAARSAASLVLTILVACLVTAPAAAQTTETDAFQRTWARTDQPVAEQLVNRSWMWGPHAASALVREPYMQSPVGERLVQYFDKARMELTHPYAADDGVWYVTNGLLVTELVSGQQQVGDITFVEAAPAMIAVAGDPDDAVAPTYATMAHVRDEPALDDGAPVIAELSRDGTVTSNSDNMGYNVYAAYRVTVPGIDHQVASPFWEFMTATGTVWEHGQYSEAALSPNPFYATGYPLTEAYWTNVTVDSASRTVLVQCFERRCLTFDPLNPDGWQVEAGNVGRHYYEWRYGTPLPSQPDPQPTGRILFRSDANGAPDLFVINPDRTGQRNLTNDPGWDLGGDWSPDGSLIAFESDRDGDADIYVIHPDGSGLQNLTNTSMWEGAPRWSPNGAQILFQADYDGNNITDELYVMEADGSNPRLVVTPAWEAGWSPDGSQIAFLSPLAFRTSHIILIYPDGTGTRQLTSESGDYSWLRWSPDGSVLAYQREVDGNVDLYTISVADGTVSRLTDDPAADRQPNWSPDGRFIAFESERGDQLDIWTVQADGTLETNLTHDTAADWCRPCSWSPDSVYVAFDSSRGDQSLGSINVFLVSVHTRETWRVTAMGSAATPLWSP